MIPLYTQEEFDSAKSRQPLPLQCKCCGKKFYSSKNEIQIAIKNKKETKIFCSNYCSYTSLNPPIIVSCKQCGKEFKKKQSQINKTKNHFCSHSCHAKYSNTHKTKGTRRSKLEAWLEQQLTQLYPNLEFHFNRKDTINSELDIYIPSLKLAFELNGIFHYEPIYGQEKLESTQNNDHRKFAACSEKGISLCVIDTSKQKYFKEQTSKKFLDIITNIIAGMLAHPI